MQEFVRRAFHIAEEAHEGQTRFGGEPYVTHSIEVANMVFESGGTDEQVAAAYLHDVLEDTDWTAEMLLIEGIPERVVEMVQLMTKVPHEPNKHYMARIAADPDVPLVKYVDMYHNLNPVAMPKDGSHHRRIKKYGEGLTQLSQVIHWS